MISIFAHISYVKHSTNTKILILKRHEFMTFDEAFLELFDYLGLYMLLTPEDKLEIYKKFTYDRIEKNTYLEKQGNITKYLYFTSSGFLQLYMEKDDEIITTQINCPTRLITTFQSFNSQQPSLENLKAITDACVLKITKNDFVDLFYKDDRWSNTARLIYEKGQVYNEQRAKNLISMSAEERYSDLLKHRPEIVQNVPVKIIASFLGMRPQSLSRIKRAVL